MKVDTIIIYAAIVAAFGLSKKRKAESVVTPEQKARVIGSIALLGWPKDEINKMIRIESGWKTTALNPVSYASGLTQLMPFWLTNQKFRPDLSTGKDRAFAFSQLSADDQLPWILHFFQLIGKTWQLPGDTYIAVAAPAYIGAPDDQIIYQVGSPAWKQNPAWHDGINPVTAGSLRKFFLNA